MFTFNAYPDIYRIRLSEMSPDRFDTCTCCRGDLCPITMGHSVGSNQASADPDGNRSRIEVGAGITGIDPTGWNQTQPR
jgi:hypothetical protein